MGAYAYRAPLLEPVKRLPAIVLPALTAVYRSYGSSETGTGSLALPQPVPNPGEKSPTDRLVGDYEGKGVSFAAVYMSEASESEKNVPHAVLRDASGELTALHNVARPGLVSHNPKETETFAG